LLFYVLYSKIEIFKNAGGWLSAVIGGTDEYRMTAMELSDLDEYWGSTYRAVISLTRGSHIIAGDRRAQRSDE